MRSAHFIFGVHQPVSTVLTILGWILLCVLQVCGCRGNAESPASPAQHIAEQSAVVGSDADPVLTRDNKLTAAVPEELAQEDPEPPKTRDGELRKAYLAVQEHRMDEGYAMFQSACTLGSHLACDEAAFHGVHTPGVSNMPMAAADLIRAGGCRSERGTACLLLARIMRSSWMLSPDLDSARRYYEVACEGGEPDACKYLADFLESTDPERAKKVRSEGCRKMGPKACLSQLERDRNAYFEKACAEGELSSCLQLAIFYGFREPPWARPEKAVKLFQKVCESRRGDGCYRLGELLRVGKAARNESAAARAYELGCSYGHSASCFQLGRMVRGGAAVAPEGTGAHDLLKRAEKLARPVRRGDEVLQRTQSLTDAYAQLDRARKTWKPPEVYCLQRRWDYKFSKFSERSLVEVRGFRMKRAQYCRKDGAGEVCRDTRDPRHVGTMTSLFDRCEREVISRDPDTHDHHVLVDEKGALVRCVATPWRCHGDCAVDLGIEKITEGPCPK